MTFRVRSLSHAVTAWAGLVTALAACDATTASPDSLGAYGSAASAFTLRNGCPAGFEADLGGDVCIAPRPVAWRALVKVRRVSPQFSSGALAYFNATESTEVVTIAESTVTPWRQALEGEYHYEHYICAEWVPGTGCVSRSTPTVSKPFVWVNQAGATQSFDAYMSPNGAHTPFGSGTAKSIQVSSAWFGEKYHFAASAILCHGPDDTRRNDDSWDRCLAFRAEAKSQRIDDFGAAEAWARQVEGPGYCLGDSFDEPTCTVPDWRIRCDDAGNCVLENTQNAAIPIVIGVGASVTAVQIAALFTAAVALGYIVNQDQNVFEQLAELRNLTEEQWANVWAARRAESKKRDDKKNGNDGNDDKKGADPDTDTDEDEDDEPAEKTCADEVHERLEREKEKWCNKLRYCHKGTECEDYKAKILAGSNCAYMRKVVMDVCFGGGDKAHRKERKTVLDTLDDCIEFSRRARESGRCP
jgi:hypothetical protein